MISGLYSNNYEERWIQFDTVQTYKIVREIDKVDRRVWFEFVGEAERE